ncbi:MAG: hypothetical protein WKG03_01325 [Telluria sp.]
MGCDNKQQIFQEKLTSVQDALTAELAALAANTEARAKEIADDFEADNDLAAGVGAAAGTAFGGFLGGPGGAAAGAVVGRQIGQLFTLEIGMQRQSVALDVPHASMETQDFSFDLPTVVMRDTDLSFDLPTIEMRTQRGPDIPEITVRWEQRCIGPNWAEICTDIPVTVVTMKETYLDVPVTVMRTQRIVLGLPTVEMRRQEMKLDLPRIEMKTTEFSVDVPYITLRFIKDAGKRTAALAAALAQSAQDEAARKQIGFQDRLRTEVAPLALDMFACHRETISTGRTQMYAQYAGQIETLGNAVAAIVAKGVPDNDTNLIAARAAHGEAISVRDAALRKLDDALAQLDASTKTAMEQFLGAGIKGAAAMGMVAEQLSFAGSKAPQGHSVASLVRIVLPT